MEGEAGTTQNAEIENGLRHMFQSYMSVLRYSIVVLLIVFRIGFGSCRPGIPFRPSARCFNLPYPDSTRLPNDRSQNPDQQVPKPQTKNKLNSYCRPDKISLASSPDSATLTTNLVVSAGAPSPGNA